MTVVTIGIDYGGKRIGIAVSESGLLATPHSVLANDERVMSRIEALARELEAEAFVVGVPRRARSADGEGKFERFADDLRQRTCKPVHLWNETLTTVEAEERLRAQGKRGVRKNEDIDMYAAAVILQSWLDDQSRRAS